MRSYRLERPRYNVSWLHVMCEMVLRKSRCRNFTVEEVRLVSNVVVMNEPKTVGMRRILKCSFVTMVPVDEMK